MNRFVFCFFMVDTYLFMGIFEHDFTELQRRRKVIYGTNRRFMPEYHTDMIGELYVQRAGAFTGKLTSILSQGSSFDSVIGASEFFSKSAVPVTLGLVSFVKNYTQIDLLHYISQDKKMNYLRAKKKAITPRLDGIYNGHVYTIPAHQHKQLLNLMGNPEQVFQILTASASFSQTILNPKTWFSPRKPTTWFKLEFLYSSKDGGSDGGASQDGPSPQFVPELELIV